MGELLAFLGVAVLVIVTPGPDTAVTIRATLLGGRTAGVMTAFGVVTGQACWSLAASAGITALLVASEPAFLAVKFAGAAYLVWLGAHALWSALRGGDGIAGAAPAGRAHGLAPWVAYRQGLVSDLGNPKMAVFFTSLLPQFASSFPSLLAHGLVFVAMTLAWLAFVAYVGGALRRWMDARGEQPRAPV